MHGDDLHVGILAKAIRAVPSMRYALAAVGLAAAVALIYSFTKGGNVAAIGTGLVLALMVVLVVFSVVAARAKTIAVGPAKFMVWSMSVAFVAAVVLVISAVSFDWPPALAKIVKKNAEVDAQKPDVQGSASGDTKDPSSHESTETELAGEIAQATWKINLEGLLGRGQEVIKLAEKELEERGNPDAAFMAGLEFLRARSVDESKRYFELARSLGHRRAKCAIFEADGRRSEMTSCARDYYRQVARTGPQGRMEALDYYGELAYGADQIKAREGIDELRKLAEGGDMEAGAIATWALQQHFGDDKAKQYSSVLLANAEQSPKVDLRQLAWFKYRLLKEGLLGEGVSNDVIDAAIAAGDVGAALEKAEQLGGTHIGVTADLINMAIEVGGAGELVQAAQILECGDEAVRSTGQLELVRKGFMSVFKTEPYRLHVNCASPIVEFREDT